MKWRTLKIIALVALANILVFGSCIALMIFSTASFSMDLTIDNQSDQNLEIYYNGIIVGNAGPGQKITSQASMDSGEYTITALNTDGEVVFAKRFTHETLIHLDDHRKAVAVIPPYIPRRGATYVDLIIENKSDMVLTILVEGKLIGDATPYESVIASNLPSPYLPESKNILYRVVANNAQGEQVFGESFNLSKFEIADFKTLKTVIEPFYMEIMFQNKTKSVVMVSVDYYNIGEIKPGETIKKNVPLYSDIVIINAEDPLGKTVYHNVQHNVRWEYQDKKWKEVITSPTN